MGIFIKNVVPNSPAGRTGEFKTGDRILDVSGIDLRRASHEKAIEAIKNAPNPLTFVLQSLVPLRANRTENTFLDKNNSSREEQHNHIESEKQEAKPKKSVKYKDRINEEKNAISRESVRRGAGGSFKNRVTELKSSMKKRDHEETNNNVAEETSEVATTNTNKLESPSDSDDEEDVRELEGRTVSAKGQEIDRASAANIKRTKEEIAADTEEEDDFGYTTKKVLKKYANLGNKVLIVQLERTQQGLGISLAGHKNRSCMAVFVCGLNPSGAAFRTGEIQVGDEILEVISN
ncbi:inaD-like protein [Agrilus planipennis]|uniref:InaD-like protein n=1 Tax=Agrilus planipennis TaxID=224129 RepID=A0A7F5R3K3_AGRPL|nr:inaD-like protein [Agrilus planipennis]